MLLNLHEFACLPWTGCLLAFYIDPYIVRRARLRLELWRFASTVDILLTRMTCFVLVSFSSGDAVALLWKNSVRLSRVILRFPSVIWSSLCFSRSMYWIIWLAREKNRCEQKSSSICQICKHYLSEHNSNVPPCLSFHVLTKCTNKFDCLIKEMFFIRKLKPSLNVQTDSIRAKVFTWKTCESLVVMLICRDYIKPPISHYLFIFALRMVSRWRRNVGF